MTKLLTKRKAKWVGTFKPEILRGSPINPNIADAQDYQKRLDRLILQMTSETERRIRSLFRTEPMREYFAEDKSPAEQAKILTDALKKKFNALFADRAEPIAESVANNADKASSAQLHSSIQKLSGGLSLSTTYLAGKLTDVLNATVAENVSLIKSISSKYLDGVQASVMRSITTGNGMQDLVPYLANQKGITLRRARMIAHDQTRKAMNNLSKGRMQNIGVQEFEWLHTGGSNEPRKDHIAMSGNIYRFDDLPVIDKKTGEKGIPGQAINCFTGSTKVSLRNGCINLWRYFHRGDIVNISVHGGSVIECTPNHPILTLRGWLPANEIQEGDYLVSSQSEHSGAIDNESANLYTTFNDLFVTLSASGFNTVLQSEFNFHGDIPKENVDHVSGNYMLSDGVESISCEQLEQLVLSYSNIVGNSGVPSLDTEIVKPCSASGTGKKNALFTGELGQSGNIGLACISQNNAIISKNSADNLPADGIGFSKIEDAFSSIVSANDSTAVIVGDSEGVLAGNNIPKPNLESLSKPTSTYTSGSGELPQSSTAIQRLFRVEKKVITVFEGHVYTMQTVNGWYNVASAEIISKNCRCKMLPVIKFQH